MLPIARGSGVWLYDHDGRRYLDAISSWWVNLFGHANPRINAALVEQLGRLEHVMLAGFTHEPAVELAERLTRLAPPGLTRCFFADNGSSAIEVALKMSFHYWRNSGQTRKRRFVTLASSYHGETLGALAVGNVELYKETYQPAADGRDHGSDAGRVPARGRRAGRGIRTPRIRGHGSYACRPRRGNLRRDHRAARAMRRGHAHACAGLPRVAARRLQPARRSLDRRRGRSRFRPHRHACSRASRPASRRISCASPRA